MLRITQQKYGFYAFQKIFAFVKAKPELHFQMQVFHIVVVLGGDLASLRPGQTIEELIMAAKKKAKKATKKKASKKKRKK
jgi:hypothetical protein